MNPSRFLPTIKSAAVAFAALAAVTVPATGAHAGGVTTNANCTTQMLGNRICIDVSANTITVYTSNTTVYASETLAGPLVADGPIPTSAWVAYDFECNAAVVNGNLVTSFKTGNVGGLAGETVTITAGSGAHGWSTAPVSEAMSNIIAWDANSNSGFECVIAP